MKGNRRGRDAVRMMKRWFGCMLLVVLVLVMPAQSTEAERAAVRARMALLQVRTAVSPDRAVIVSGPQSEGNAFLLEAVQQMQAAFEQLSGLRLALGEQQIRIQVGSKEAEDVDAVASNAVLLRIERNLAGVLEHRIELADYASVWLPEARDAVVYAILSAHVARYLAQEAPPRLPAWLWQGVLQLLTVDDVDRTLLRVRALWNAGQVPGLAALFAGDAGERLSGDDLPLAGAFVYGLFKRPSAEGLVDGLFQRLAAGETVDMAWLQGRLGMDADEWFDRWILAQRDTIRGIGAVTSLHIEDLRGAVRVVPGLYGIPRGEIIGGSRGLTALLEHREKAWFAVAVRRRRQILEGLAQGRPERYQRVVADYLTVLDGVVAGGERSELEELESWGLMELSLLSRDVEQAGGIWREE